VTEKHPVPYGGNPQPTRPTVSIVTPVFRPRADHFSACAESVLAQVGDWEWILVDDGSNDPELTFYLKSLAELHDCIVHHTLSLNLGISEASNAAIEVAAGRFIALLDQDDALAPNAIAEVLRVISECPEVAYIYSDEDKIDDLGQRFGPLHKPGWSPELLRQMMYTCHLSVLRTDLVRKVGGFRPDFDGAQDYDLVLRVTEGGAQVRHIPRILYHWRAHQHSTAQNIHAKPYALDASRRALQDHLGRAGIQGEIVPHSHLPGCWSVRRHVTQEPIVSVVIPTAWTRGTIRRRECFLVENLLWSLQRAGHGQIREVILVANKEPPAGLFNRLQAIVGFPIRLIMSGIGADFNFSQQINRGALAARGSLLLLLNDDTEVVSDDWLSEIVPLASGSDVGAVGIKLLFEDELIQHAGVAPNPQTGGLPVHVARGLPTSHMGNGARFWFTHEVMAVTGAFLAVAKDKFFGVGGMCADFPINFNDIDLCLKLEAAGLRNLYVPAVEAFHFESRSRQPGATIEEIVKFRRRWGVSGLLDRLQNPNLQIHTQVEFDDWEDVTRLHGIPVTSSGQLERLFDSYRRGNHDLSSFSDSQLLRHFAAHGSSELRCAANVAHQ